MFFMVGGWRRGSGTMFHNHNLILYFVHVFIKKSLLFYFSIFLYFYNHCIWEIEKEVGGGREEREGGSGTIDFHCFFKVQSIQL